MKQNLCLTFFLMEESMSVGNILCLFFNYFLLFCSASFRKKESFCGVLQTQQHIMAKSILLSPVIRIHSKLEFQEIVLTGIFFVSSGFMFKSYKQFVASEPPKIRDLRNHFFLQNLVHHISTNSFRL